MQLRGIPQVEAQSEWELHLEGNLQDSGKIQTSLQIKDSVTRRKNHDRISENWKIIKKKRILIVYYVGYNSSECDYGRDSETTHMFCKHSCSANSEARPATLEGDNFYTQFDF